MKTLIKTPQERDNRESGNTLQEILVAIVVLAILATIAVTFHVSVLRAGYDNKVVTEAQVVTAKVMEYKGDLGEHPGSLSDLEGFRKTSSGNMFALVTDGTTMCVLAYNPDSGEHTQDSPYIEVFQDFVADKNAESCPLGNSGAVWE